MIDHFFREGLPTYDMQSLDKPNEYDSDWESYPAFKVLVNITDSLLCFSHETEKFQKVVACKTNVEYEFKRELIRQLKKELVEQI